MTTTSMRSSITTPGWRSSAFPVIFTPYFSMPDPSVKRRSGFLTPVIGQSTNLGFQYQQPYFWAIAPDKDLTISPMINSKAPPVLTGEYRQRLVDGKITVDFAGTDINLSNYQNSSGATIPDNGTQPEGFVHATGQFDLTDNWRARIRHRPGDQSRLPAIVRPAGSVQQLPQQRDLCRRVPEPQLRLRSRPGASRTCSRTARPTRSCRSSPRSSITISWASPTSSAPIGR